MDSNWSQKLEAVKHFILKPLFLVGLVLGIILGVIISYFCGLSVNIVFKLLVIVVLSIVTGIVSNYVSGVLRKRQRGVQPYCNSSYTIDSISLEAQVPNTAANQTALSEIIKSTISSDN